MNEEIKSELEYIRNENGGFLHPEKVVEYAKDPNSALHSRFTWDDNEAAAKYRIAEARAIIRVAVIINDKLPENTRAYVSLSADRREGGYRATTEVINDEILSEIMLQDCIKELTRIKLKYDKIKSLCELDDLFSAIDNVIRKNSDIQIEVRPSA